MIREILEKVNEAPSVGEWLYAEILDINGVGDFMVHDLGGECELVEFDYSELEYPEDYIGDVERLIKKAEKKFKVKLKIRNERNSLVVLKK